MLLSILFSVAAFAAAPPEASYKATSSTSAGQGNFSEGLSVGGDHPVSEKGAVDWNGGYTFSRAPVGSGSDKTNDVDLSVGFRERWDVGGGASFSSTPDENLKSAGPEAWLGYVFGIGAKDSDHSIEPKFTYKGATYTQTFSGVTTLRPGTRRAVTRPVSGSQSIRQNELAIGVDVSPADLASFRLKAATYKYSRDVNSFLALLDSPRAVSTGASSFSTTLGGFPKSSAEAGVTFYPWETWDFTLDFTRTKVQVDNSTSTSSKFEVEKELSKAFKLGLGFDHEKSEQQGEENLTLLDLTFGF